MLSLAINTLSFFLLKTSPMKLSFGKSLENLKCRIVEVNEQQDFINPTFPCDDNNYRGDTTYRLPKRLNVRVYVKERDIKLFEINLNRAQLSGDFFTLNSMYNIIYKNLKISSYARDLNSNMIGATHFNITLQEVILVKALVENYKNASNVGYSKKIESGSKNPQKIEKSSTAYQGLKSLGF
ncbi:hypothetical protein [Campylobacter sp.]|uniref:hypothetical protein n=1 Tax=Campylobacter sp. TaxID=205 RepID=UPI0025B98ADD|nr:hypothetical protein [Campylobacter sp.]